MKGPSRRLRPFCCWTLGRNSVIAAAHVDAIRSEVGPHRPPAASADIERTAEVTMAMTVMMTMTVAVPTVHAMSAMAVATTMSTTVATVTASRSGGNGGSGQSERGDSCERDLAKHYLVVSSC